MPLFKYPLQLQVCDDANNYANFVVWDKNICDYSEKSGMNLVSESSNTMSYVGRLGRLYVIWQQKLIMIK
ncbi:hypothetical protein DEO72_LG6g423 [Vigna unguiculata]|uniref:Nucleic acid-binding n=1 Tax=Vigna unguiculata TaxID=3917 RepID=A0A4D6M558_VIGUN|nr:hypothetical protein DEO72_LG6g423 [Vigna unguiculata]